MSKMLLSFLNVHKNYLMLQKISEYIIGKYEKNILCNPKPETPYKYRHQKIHTYSNNKNLY